MWWILFKNNEKNALKNCHFFYRLDQMAFSLVNFKQDSVVPIQGVESIYALTKIF